VFPVHMSYEVCHVSIARPTLRTHLHLGAWPCCCCCCCCWGWWCCGCACSCLPAHRTGTAHNTGDRQHRRCHPLQFA
jgi:hypothetical protein